MLASLSLASVGVRMFLSVCNYTHLNMCAFMSIGVFGYYVHICVLKCVFALVWGSASRLCVQYLCFLSYTGHSQWHCEVFFLHWGKSTKGTLAWANSPSSHFYPALFSPNHASFLPPSAPLFLVSWWGDPDVKGGGDLDRKRRARKREIEIHWWQTSLSKTFWTSF